MVNGYGAILCSAVEQVGSEFNKVMKIKSKLKLQRPGRTRMGRLDDLHKASSRSWDSFAFDSASGSAPRLVRSGRAANFSRKLQRRVLRQIASPIQHNITPQQDTPQQDATHHSKTYTAARRTPPQPWTATTHPTPPDRLIIFLLYS